VIRSLVGLVLANACFLAAGAGVVRLLGWRVRKHLGRAYMAGVAVVGVLLTLLLIAGLALQWWEALVLCGLLASLGLVRKPPAEDAPGRPDRRIALPAVGLLAGYLAVLLVQCLYQLLDTWDAWSQWTMKARAIVLLGGLNPALFANHAAIGDLHLDYPLLLPGVEAVDFRFMGQLDTKVLHVQFWLLLVGFLVAVYELLRDRVPQTLLWPTLLVLGTAPALVDNLTSADADVPEAFFFALAALAAWRYVVAGDRRDVWLFALMSGAAMATKAEGEPYIALLFVLLLVAAWAKGRRLTPVGLAAVWCVISIVPWQFWTSRHGIKSTTPLHNALSPSYLVHNAGRGWDWIRWLWHQSLTDHWVAILPLAVVVVVLVLIRRSARADAGALFAVGVLVAVFLALLWGYIARPLGITELLASSGRRTMTALVVAAAVFLPVLGAEFASSWRPGAPRPASPRAWRGWWRPSTRAARSTAA
jgi:hypothetical protein